MKALLCKQYGPPESLVVESLPDLVPGERQVVIDVRAAGVNFPDTLIIEGKYQFKPPPPFSPGGECAGVVRAVGSGVTNVKPGDRVIAMTIFGAFAEQVVADAGALVPMPPGLDFPVAAAFMMTYGTSYHALADRGALAAGETLLVLGASGGVGLAAVEIGKALGARVIAAASSAEKLAVCREHGADDLIDYAREDLRERVKALAGGHGVDVVYDPVGGAYTEPALRSIAWRGRHLIVGFANGGIPRIPANLALLKGAAIVGVFWGDYVRREPARIATDLRTLFAWLGEGRLRPRIAATYPLARGGEAIRALMERRVSGKLVVLPGE
ncbi:MAG: NADPH:quinone oxidoreductase family protein [Steroidobacteraceae bacterium]